MSDWRFDLLAIQGQFIQLIRRHPEMTIWEYTNARIALEVWGILRIARK